MERVIRAGERTIELAENSGFCFGVRRAIRMAEETLGRGGRVYSLGPVIHNPQEIVRLEGMGLRVIKQLEEVEEPGILIIRSHGVSPATAAAAEAKGLELVDATCPLVKRAQSLARKLHEEDYRVIIVGDAQHPEVEAILGYAPGAAVIDGPDCLDDLVMEQRLGIVSQTTQSPRLFRETTAEAARRFHGHELRVFHTICNATVDRQAAAMELAKRVDVMIVLGGHNSANTRELARLCVSTGVPTHHLETAEELTVEMLSGRLRVGVTAGASTPAWLVDQFIETVKGLDA
ncbi:MAG: 4-hydroxy-3-methylbut-2-enyl diphosphate reductase [Planctomycetes bacterium]|nr:4-hydroxy-3-methylbut-2-enyl diphosphate reductase [Planctomycetota bacterium]